MIGSVGWHEIRVRKIKLGKVALLDFEAEIDFN